MCCSGGRIWERERESVCVQAINVKDQVNGQRAEKIQKNWNFITGILEFLILMAKQNMAIQGHIQENGNFNAMIQYATTWSRYHTSK